MDFNNAFEQGYALAVKHAKVFEAEGLDIQQVIKELETIKNV
jgi:hypothetical protein